MDGFSLTGVQAQAILDMRLARLTNLETIQLEKELTELASDIARFHRILENDGELVKIIRKELLDIRKKYDDPRRTSILSAQEAQLNIDETALLPREDCTVIQTRGGGLKRMTPKSLQRSLENYASLDEKLKIVRAVPSNTANRVYVITSAGNEYIIPAIQIPEQRLRDAGKPLSSFASGIAKDEEIVAIFDDEQMKDDLIVWFGTASGLVKGVKIQDLKARKTKVLGCALREGDRLVSCTLDNPDFANLTCVSTGGCSLTFSKDDVPVQGKTAYGARSIRMKEGERVLTVSQTADDDQTLLLIAVNGDARQYWTSGLRTQGRNGKGESLFSGKPVCSALVLDQISTLTIQEPDGGIRKTVSSDVPTETPGELPLMAKYTPLNDGKRIRQIYANLYE